MALGATDANAIALPGPPSVSAPAPGVGFTSAAAFSGVKPGMVFKTGLQGIGYYPDTGLQSAAAQTPAVLAATGVGSVSSDQMDLLFVVLMCNIAFMMLVSLVDWRQQLYSLYNCQVHGMLLLFLLCDDMCCRGTCAQTEHVYGLLCRGNKSWAS